MYYSISGFCIYSCEDSYNEGEIGHSNFNSLDLDFDANSKEDLIKKLKSYFSVDELEFEGDEVRFARLETADGFSATKSDINSWKKGEKRLYSTEYSGRLTKVTEENWDVL